MKLYYRTILNLIKNRRWQSEFFRYCKFFLALFLVLAAVINLGIYVYLKDKNRNAADRLLIDSVTTAGNTINNIFDTIYKNYTIYSSDTSFDRFFSMPPDRLFSMKSTSVIQNVIDIMNYTTRSYNYIDSVYVYSFASDYVLSTKNSNYLDNFQDKTWYNAYMESKKSQLIIPSTISNKNMPEYSVLAYCIENISGNTKSLIVTNINVSALDNMLKSITDGKYTISLLDADNRCIYSTKNEYFGNLFDMKNTEAQKTITTLDSSKKVICVYSLSKFNCKLVFSEYSASAEDRTTYNILIFLLISAFLSIFLTVILSFATSMYSYRSIAEILSQIDDTNCGRDDFNEINYITNNIISITDSNAKIEQELASKITLLNKSRTIALQTQINPHFLFNTLNMVNLIIMRITKSDNDATTIISLLSDLLHYSLDTDRNIISLGEEIEYSKKYLEIERIKYANMLNVSWDIEDGTKDMKTVKFILQPLLENSIEHGFEQFDSGNNIIYIKSYTKNNKLFIELKDNGVGMSQDKLLKLRSQLEQNDLPESKHIGIINVNQRLKLIFGTEYSMKIFSDNHGTEIIIETPILKNSDKD